MAKVSEYIISLVGKWLDQAGIVVWYDLSSEYGELVSGSSKPAPRLSATRTASSGYKLDNK